MGLRDKLRAIKAKIKNGWSKFTGEADFKEAGRLLAELELKAKKAQEEFEKVADEASAGIAESMTRINSYRLGVCSHFDRFTELSGMFANWEVEGVDFIEEYKTLVNTQFNVRSKDELFSIDFTKNRVKTTFQAIFTLGFFTRKKAKETLNKVKEESKAFEGRFAAIEAEKKRLVLLEKQLRQVVLYMDEMFMFYDEVLAELDFSVKTLQANYFYNNISYFGGRKMDCYYLPKRHLLCLMATEQTTRIIHKMVSHKYLTEECSIVMEEMYASENYNQKCMMLKEQLKAA